MKSKRILISLILVLLCPLVVTSCGISTISSYCQATKKLWETQIYGIQILAAVLAQENNTSGMTEDEIIAEIVRQKIQHKQFTLENKECFSEKEIEAVTSPFG